MTAIIKKEMKTYFTSMTGYIFLLFLVLLTAIYFVMYCVSGLYANYSSVLSSTLIVFLILIPTLTMRLFAEEARQRTDQLLFTSPVTITQIVVGKFIAAFSLFLFAMAITALFPLMLSRYGTVPTAHIFTAFIGYILLGACLIAIGLFISVLTNNQIVAAVGTFAVIFSLFMLDSSAPSFPVSRFSSIVFLSLAAAGLAGLMYSSTRSILAGLMTGLLCAAGIILMFLFNRYFFDGLIYKFTQWISLLARFDDFNVGVLNLSHIVYYITFAVAFVFLTTNVLEKRRWK